MGVNDHRPAEARKNFRTESTSSSIESESSHRQRRLNMPIMYQMYESQYEDLRGTVYGPESPEFHPVQACERLRKAISGIDTNDGIIISTILHHDNFQRQKILSAYEDMYSRNLLEDLEEETGGFFLDTVQALFKPAHLFDTQSLYKSISNRYGDRSVAVEIACTRSARQLRVIRETYQNEYRKSIEKDISVKVEGVVGRMLTLILCKTRDEGNHTKIDTNAVNELANLFLSNPIEEITKNVQLFEQLFTGHSWKFLGAVFDRVDEIRKDDKDVETMIRKNKNLHSEIRLIMLTIVRVSRNMQLYLAEKLRAAMNGDRPDHNTIVRILVSRSEIDLLDVNEEYKCRYHRSLEQDIQQTCSGDYLRLLTSLLSGSINNNNPYH